MSKLTISETQASEVTKLIGINAAYALIDACDTPSVLQQAQERAPESARSLFKGQSLETLSSISPFLFVLEEDLLRWLAKSLWDQPWGILIQAQCDFNTLHSHLRRFTVVRSPAGEALFFRFYDPRVLKTYLQACSSDALKRFFGPVTAFATRHEEDRRLVRWYCLGEEED